MKPTIVIISLIIGMLVIDLMNYPTAAQAPFKFTDSSGMGLDSNGRFNVGMEARGPDITPNDASVAEKTFDLTVIPKKVWVDSGSITLVPQQPSFSFWSGLHIQLEAALLRMYFIPDNGDRIQWFNEILNANFGPVNLQITPFEIDLPPANHWQLKAIYAVAGGGKFVDTEVELAGHWQ